MRVCRINYVAPLLLCLTLLVACGGDNTNTESPTATSVPGSPASTPSAISSAENVIADTSNDEPFTKPTPPGGAAPTAEPPMESSFDTDGDGFITRDELKTALDARLPEFEWPAGYTLSIETVFALHTSEVPADSVFENNAEYSMLGIPHMCAWGTTWLNANQTVDDSTKETAMNQLERVTLNLPTLRFVTDYYADIFDKAQLGDVAPLQNLVDTRCNWGIFESTPEALNLPLRSNGTCVLWA